MMQDDEIEQKLKIYDAAIDFYMDVGRLPDTISPDDILGEFIAHTIDDNPQLSSQDHLWSELLKDEMLSFIENMLDVFQPIEETYRKEKAYIKLFSCGDIETKIKMWSKVVYTIRLYYILEEINIDGYIKQLETEDQETVYNAFLKDWDRASYERQMRRKRQALEQNRKEWEQQVKNHGLTDYRSRQKIEHIFYSYPKLKEILKIIGREEQIRVEEMDETVLHYLPLLPSAPRPAKEVEEIANGKDLQHLLPSELAIMSEHQTENLFYLKYATGQLQLFANRPKEESQLKTDQKDQKKPRLGNGPIIVAVDTSGSMSGRAIEIAYSLLLQLLNLAKKQKRKCFLISFAVRAQYLDLSLPSNRLRLDDFLTNKFTGGTNGEQMLNAAINMLQTDNYSMADVLIISDFYFPAPIKETRKKMQIEHSKGTKYYGLKIGVHNTSTYDNILDKCWIVG